MSALNILNFFNELMLEIYATNTLILLILAAFLNCAIAFSPIFFEFNEMWDG